MLTKILKKIEGFILFGPGACARKFFRRRLPDNPDGKVLIHIGCGDLQDKRYINVDSRPGWHIHYVHSIQECAGVFPPDHADLIYACHVLEHLPYADLPATLKDLRRVLKDGGILRLSVPDFDVIVGMYRERKRIEDIVSPLMGGQGYPANFHASVFNERYLTESLFKSGFRDVRPWDPATAAYHDFDDWSGRTIALCGARWHISLNLEAVK